MSRVVGWKVVDVRVSLAVTSRRRFIRGLPVLDRDATSAPVERVSRVTLEGRGEARTQ